MVNYCCVSGCGRNSRHNSHLKFYSLPKERHRQLIWLEAAGREDLLNKEQDKVNGYRFCSRHFLSASVKNRNLIPDAVPTLHLPGTFDEEDLEDKPALHDHVTCNGCRGFIQGFRYKCVTCKDYDLCQKCEMNERHPEHFMIRIPRPMKYQNADNLSQKWKMLFKKDHITADNSDSITNSDSSDDEPITKYIKNYDSGVDLTDDIKFRIRQEITRAINASKETVKRSAKGVEGISKKKKLGKEFPYEIMFADVNEISTSAVDIKSETSAEEMTSQDNLKASTSQSLARSELIQTALEGANIDSSDLVPIMHVKLSEDLNVTIELMDKEI